MRESSPFDPVLPARATSEIEQRIREALARFPHNWRNVEAAVHYYIGGDGDFRADLASWERSEEYHREHEPRLSVTTGKHYSSEAERVALARQHFREVEQAYEEAERKHLASLPPKLYPASLASGPWATDSSKPKRSAGRY